MGKRTLHFQQIHRQNISGKREDFLACAIPGSVTKDTFIIDDQGECFKAAWAKHNPGREYVRPEKFTITKVVRGAAGLVSAATNTLFPKEGFDQMVAERRDICRNCPRWTGSHCQICLCLTEAKIRAPGESCPDNPPRWNAVVLSSGE